MTLNCELATTTTTITTEMHWWEKCLFLLRFIHRNDLIEWRESLICITTIYNKHPPCYFFRSRPLTYVRAAFKNVQHTTEKFEPNTVLDISISSGFHTTDQPVRRRVDQSGASGGNICKEPELIAEITTKLLLP